MLKNKGDFNLSNGFTNFGKEDLLTILTSNNYPNENVNEVLGSPQFVKNGSCDFYQTLIAEFPDLQILDLLPNNDKFLGYGNFTNSDGKLQGIMFIVNDQLQLQSVSYQDSTGNVSNVNWLTTYDYQGNEVALPVLQKLKIDNSGYVYGIIQRDPDEDHSNYNYLWYLVKFNDFLSVWYNNFELFLINDFLVSDNIQINNNTSIENSYILDTPIIDISQNETNQDYYQIIYVKKAPQELDQNAYNIVINVIDLSGEKFEVLSDVQIPNNSLNFETVGTKSIQLEGKYDSTNSFIGAILVTCPINIFNLVPHTVNVTDTLPNWNDGVNNTFQSSTNTGSYEIDYYSGSHNLGTLTNATNTYASYQGQSKYTNYKITFTVNSASFTVVGNNFGIDNSTGSFTGDIKNISVDFETYQEIVRTQNAYTAYGASAFIISDLGNKMLIGSGDGKYNSTEMNHFLSGSASNISITSQIYYEEVVYTISQNGVILISVTQNADTNYLVDATVDQAMYDNEAALTPQLINSSTGYISIQKQEDDTFGIYKFSTDDNSADPLLLNSTDNFINNEPIYISTIGNQDVQDTTIIGINNPNSKTAIGLNLYKKSNDLNPTQISFISQSFDTDQPAFASVSGLRQQNKIFIFGFSENFATYCLFINEYNNGTPNSKPYFFLPYSNINSNFLLSRVQAQDSNAIVAADVNIEDNASVNNNFILNAVLEQYTMNNQDNSVWYIVNQSNNDVFYSDTTISKDIMEEKQVSFNVLISYINQTDNYTNSAFSIKLAQLYLNDEMTQDFLDQIYIKTMRLTFKNGSTQTLDIPWEIDLLTYEANADFTLELANSTNDLVKLEYLYADGSVNWTKTFSDANANKFIKIKSNIKFSESDNN